MELSASIDAAVAPCYKADAPGATVIVSLSGKTMFRQAYGLACMRDTDGTVAKVVLHQHGEANENLRTTGVR